MWSLNTTEIRQFSCKVISDIYVQLLQDTEAVA